MLARARQKAPAADFRVGDLTALPVDTASVDVATCGLALTHLLDPGTAIAELARVVKPGRRVVISDAHPIFVLIQGQALFPQQGAFAYVRTYPTSTACISGRFGKRDSRCCSVPRPYGKKISARGS
jgi:ubiquinone/menaquinone biosynthesis C-methylase UbiE